MPATTLYAACYDVSADGERARVAKVLEGYGMRVQGSVFECRLTRSARGRLVAEVESLKLATGFLLIYPLESRKQRIAVGTVPKETPQDGCFAHIV